MLTVAADPGLVERQLKNGELRCPRCEVGVLGGHGWVPTRWLRKTDGQMVLLKAHASAQEKASGLIGDGLRRGRCKAAGCQVSHVLAPPRMLARRLDEVTVIGAALQARAQGLGYRRIAGRLGRVPQGEDAGWANEIAGVRRWVGRFTGNAGRLRAVFTALVHRVDVSPPVMTFGGSLVAEAVSAVGEAVAAVRRLLGAVMPTLSPWQVAAAVCNGGLLAVVPPARLFSTSGHLSMIM